MRKHKLEMTERYKGFSLGEMSIVFLMVGFSMMMGARFLTVYTQQERLDYTAENLKITQSAIQEFFALKGRYPCPSDPTLPPTDEEYGMEMCANGWREDKTCTGTVPGIKCVNVGTRDADGDGVNDYVAIGGLPFKTIFEAELQTPFVSNTAQDALFMQFTYAVSTQMAGAGSPASCSPPGPPDGPDDLPSPPCNALPSKNLPPPVNFNLGAIRIVDENQRDLTDPPQSGHFVIISHGDNQRGGYNKQGTLVSRCLTALEEDPDDNPDTPPPSGFNAAGIAPEKENCDGNDGIFISALRSMEEGSDYFDDMVAYASTGLRTHWRRSITSAEANIYNTNLRNVGVAVKVPDEKLHVKDNISAERNIAAIKFCSLANDDCLHPNTIAGTGIKCPDGMVAWGIEDNKILCRALFLTAPLAQCGLDVNGDQTFLVGFSNKGNIHCEVLPP